MANDTVNYARIYVRPLSYDKKDIAIPKEVLVDYKNHQIYICDENGNIVSASAPASEVAAAVMDEIINNPEALGKVEFTLESGDVITLEEIAQSASDSEVALDKVFDNSGKVILQIPAANVTTDSTHQFVTASDKTSWNNVVNKLFDSSGKVILQIPAANVTTDSTHQFVTAEEKTKIGNISINGEANQNAFSNIKAGSIVITAGTTTDTLTIIAGSNITLSPNINDKSITIASKAVDYSNATTEEAGLMSPADKIKLNSLATVATSGKYSDLSGVPSIPAASSTTPSANGNAVPGTSNTWARADHVHPLQTTVSGNAGSATKLATARNISLTGGATGAATSFDGSKDISISVTAIDGSKITGIIPLSSIPKGAQERLIPVANDTARLALTSSNAQNGDVVKVESTGIMYYIIDENKLGGASAEDAFSVFTAGAASSVAWSSITGKPNFATVATSGKYSDLSGVPSIPAASNTTPSANGNAVPGTSNTWARADHVHPLQTNITGNAATATNVAWSGVTGKPNFATVATSGKYSDLSGVPSAATTSAAGLMSAADKTKLDGIEIVTYTVATTTSWSGSAAPYTQTLTVTGITANDNPIADLKPSNAHDMAIAELAEFDKIYRITTAANSITLYATEKTNRSFVIQLKCIR